MTQLADPTREALIGVFTTQMDAYAALNIDALLATFSEDCVLQDMADPDHPHRGIGEIRVFLEEYFAALDNVTVQVVTRATTADKIIGELEVNATYIAAPYSRDNGRRVVLRYVAIDTVRDGKICHERFYWDRAELERQLA
jgi:steroid delta-isomerase-like uncharacterized protein